jgi:hypothetical protein
MPAERVSMRRVREILRLKHACGASDRALGRSLGIARSTVALTLDRGAAAGLAWPLPETLSDRVLEAMLYAGAGTKQGVRRKAEPDWTHVHRELRRPGVTLMLLWEEYRAREPGGYGYSRWCDLYRTWEGRLSPSMRQAHPAGERLHEEFKRWIKTQTVLPSAETAAMLFWALPASGQITRRKVDGWQTLAEPPAAMPVDLAA